MLLTNKNKNSGVRFIYLKPVSKKDGVELKSPYFEAKAKNENGVYETLPENSNTVTGKLYSVGSQIKELGEKKIKTPIITLAIEDESSKERYILDLGMRLSTRSLINAVLGLELGDDIKISYSRNKKGYEVFYVSKGDNYEDRADWKYTLAEIPQPEEVTIRGVKSKDYFNIDTWFVDKVQEVFSKPSQTEVHAESKDEGSF